MDKKILVIGNDIQTEALLSQAFSDSDSQVLIISGNISSVKPSGLIGPDLIIFDRLLQGAPDWHTLRQIRQLSSVPIIVLTDVEDSQVRIKSLDMGADYCLSKPLDMEELQARVRVLLRRAPNAEVPAWPIASLIGGRETA
jgi:two-component system KDP operon response regulator KdpE